MKPLLTIFFFFLSIYLASAQDAISSTLLDLINEERRNAGIGEVYWNTQLVVAAQKHSDDMAQYATLSHIGSDGSQFGQRIQSAGYDLITGAENVLRTQNQNADDVFQQWWDSSPHRANMLNPLYRDIGVAYTQNALGDTYFTLILAASAQGDVPQEFTPTQQPTPILLSSTMATTPTHVPTQAIRTLVPTDEALGTVLAPIPASIVQASPMPVRVTATPESVDIRLMYSADSFTMINVSGRVLNLAQLTFESASGFLSIEAWKTEDLSQSLSSFSPGGCVQAWHYGMIEQRPPEDCTIRHSWIIIPQDKLFWERSDFFVIRNDEIPVGVCSILDTVCDVTITSSLADLVSPQANSIPDIRLIYNADSFSLVNVSGHALDLTGLAFSGDTDVLSIQRWDTEFLTQPLWMFNSGGCLQAWGLEANQLFPASPECRVRHAWIALGSAYDFWRDGDTFSVTYHGTHLAICSVAAGICEITMPEREISTQSASYPEQIPEAQVAPFSGIRLIITDESVALLNLSSQAVDVSQLAFESDNGVFTASRWNTPELSRPLEALPAGDCLQIWRVGGDWIDTPELCRYRHAWVAVRDDEQFWRNVTGFRVRKGSDFLVTCSTNTSFCTFDLP